MKLHGSYVTGHRPWREVQALRKIAHDPGDMQITSHCPFCGSGQVIGRSDGNIECEFCGMTYLVRIQPMFTGMPQQPMGAGFGGPSSMATDLMAPGMVDPETGMPMDPGAADPMLAGEENEAGMPFGSEGGEEMSPDEEMELEAGPPGTQGSEDGMIPGGEELPPGEEGEEGGDVPPWAADEEGGGEEDSGPPPEAKEKGSDKKKDKKDKGKKKEGALVTSSWRYTELLDHMAAPVENGGHGLDRDAVSQVGHTSGFLRRLHQMQHHMGKDPGHGHGDEYEGKADERLAARRRTAAMRHEDMNSGELRYHMRKEHGFHDVHDDPDWLIDQTHREDHADDPHHSHTHPDFEEEQADLSSADRDWLGGHGITGRRYQTIAGDWLPEDAYIRHLACLHGGIEAVKLGRAS